MDKEEAANHIVDSATAIHTAFGPGLLESVYRRCLMYELGCLLTWKFMRIRHGIQSILREK
ncbi:MAG: GxxExxY protein, partial [Acidobacteriota bacterium]